MDHQSDVHHESLQGQHQRIQEQHQQQNIVYIQQNPQHYRNQNHYSYINETSSGITGNQSFQNQNASFGQFDNNYSFVTNGHFPSSNASTTLISDSLEGNKVKNVQLPVKTPQYYTENDGETTDGHQGGELPIQFASGNFQSVDLQSLNYQQASPYYLQNIGNHYQLNDNIVPMYQSSGSSESSDESSASNVSQIQYSSDSGGISSNQFDFPVPVTTNNQIGQNLQQLQQKDFLDNYMALVHQEAQLPRCDSSKSETAESTCSSLSSASSESQSESENVLRLPLIVNPIMSDNANILHSYQSNIQNNMSSYANSIDQSVSNEFQKHYTQNNQGLLKYSNLNGTVNQNVTNENVANNINNTNNNIINNNMQLNHDNQVNNLLVMVPNRMNNKNNENCLQTNVNQQILQNPSSQEVLNSSKFIIQNSSNNQKSNQQKIYSLINVANPMLHPIQVNQMIKLNSESGNQEVCNQSNSACSIQNNTSAFGMCSNEEDGRANSNKHNCGSITTNPVSLDHHTTSEVTDACTSHIQNTSDSSVINSNFVQNNAMSVINGIESEHSSAMLLKETSDKSISQSVSDVNSSVVNSNSVYLIKNDENNVIKSDSFADSSSKTCFNVSSGINLVPVPAGWRRLLVDGSIIYLSPTNVALSSIDQVKMYLQTTGTCKCGLECPVNCDSVFNFNPKVISRPWDLSDSEQTRLCNHKRKAPLPPGISIPGADQNIKLSRKEIISTKRKTKKNGSSGSGVSVSQLLAQRDRALAAATAGGTRWTTPSIRPGLVGVGYQNVVAAPGPGGNQFQNVQVVRQQTPGRPNAVHCTEAFVRDVAPARGPDDKVASFPCINVINREGTVLNLNEMGQLLPESMDSTGDDLIRSSQLNSLGTTRQEPSQGVINNSADFGQCGQEFIQNNVITSKPEGVLLGSQEMMFPSNMVMQRPRTIPPWHQTRLGHNKKPTVPETPVIYEKVPFVQQPMAPPAIGFDDVSNRKKAKPPAKIKKASHEPTQPTSSQPSFMDNPSAYLAQQTALLHNTISRPNFNLLPDTQSATELPQNLQNSLYTSANSSQGIQDNIVSVVAPTSASVSSRSVTFSVRPSSGQKFDQNNLTQLQSCHQVDGKSELTSCATKNNALGNHVCSNTNCADCKKTVLLNSNNKENLTKAGWRENGLSNTMRREEENCSMDENPVTSSTEKVAFGNFSQKIIADTRPIQGGTVSTSNGSPQPQPSPNSSNVFIRQEVSSSKHSAESQGSTIQISSTNSFLATSNSCGTKSGQENDVGLRQLQLNGLSEKNGAAVLQALQTFDCKTPTVGDQKQNFVSCNLLNVTTSSSDSVVESNSSGDLRKVQSVTSSLDDEKNHPEGEVKVNRYVRTMASSNTASSNTITSVQAGKTQTTTVTVSNSPTVPSTAMSLFNLSNQSLLNVQVTQKGSNKSPLEMVQSVVSSIHSSGEAKNDLSTNMIPVTKSLSQTTQPLSGILTSTANVTTSILAGSNASTASVLKTSPGTLQTGHILVSSNGQYLVAANGNIMPQTNLGGLKLNQTTSMPPMSASPVVTNVTGAMTQVLPAVGVAQQVLGQSTVLVNAVPAPFVIQPGVMAVDTGLGRLAVATGNVLQGSVLENNALRNSVRGVIPTEKIKYKKGTKKRKNPMTSLVQMASPNNVILNQPFGQQNFTVSPGGSVQPLQALTLVQGKHGQIVMNNQNNFNQFNSQPQQINLLQPVNLTSVQNFPAFQQFIVPGLGNMVMATDGTTTILPETTNIGVQLQLQNVNGQNVLTPVQNTSFLNGPGILTTPTGMFIRAPSSQQKIIQNNASPQFLSPNNGQFLVNQFQGQLSPIIAANLSPNQQIFATSPQRQSPQEFIQIIPTSSSQNTTVVQQNTTIVQQQTTMVSNSQNLLNNNSRKSNFILSNCNSDKPIEVQIVNTSQRQSQTNPTATNSQVQSSHQQPQSRRLLLQEKVDFGTQHSVSTQTNVSEEQGTNGVSTNNTFCQTLTSNWSGSPPDTTTHSPVESVSTYERVQSPAEEGADSLRQAMVQYVSSSINENEGETDGYLIPGMPKSLEALSRVSTKGKNVVESSTILQETGVQIQIGSSYLSSDHLKSAVDECIVSSHSDVGIHEKHMGESQSNVSSYQKDKIRLVDALLAETKSDDLDDEGLTEAKEKFREGDLVWGPVRGSPAWPGKLVGPIGPGDKALVRWFGGHSSPTKVNVSQLQSLSQGLEAHHRASNKGRKNRRLNAELEAAIQEAMLELDRMTTQGKKTSTGRGRPRRLNR